VGLTAPVTVFDEATAVVPAGAGCYDVKPDQRFAIVSGDGSVVGAVNGGVLMATVLRAVLDSSPHPYPVATSAHFLRVPRPEPAQVQVAWLKQGKTAATARASLIQDGVLVLETTVTTGALGPAGGDVGLSWTGEPPLLPPIEECVGFGKLADSTRFAGFAAQVDLRLDPATTGWRWTRCRRWCSAWALWAGPPPWNSPGSCAPCRLPGCSGSRPGAGM